MTKSNERYERAEMPAWYSRGADALNRELTLYRELKYDLDTMGQAKVSTRWHRDRVRQLAIVVRSLAPRGLIH
jgi:hypothetical protein